MNIWWKTFSSKNLTIEFKVNNFRQQLESRNLSDWSSEPVRMFGIDWTISVELVKKNELSDESLSQLLRCLNKPDVDTDADDQTSVSDNEIFEKLSQGRKYILAGLKAHIPSREDLYYENLSYFLRL